MPWMRKEQAVRRSQRTGNKEIETHDANERRIDRGQGHMLQNMQCTKCVYAPRVGPIRSIQNFDFGTTAHHGTCMEWVLSKMIVGIESW